MTKNHMFKINYQFTVGRFNVKLYQVSLIDTVNVRRYSVLYSIFVYRDACTTVTKCLVSLLYFAYVAFLNRKYYIHDDDIIIFAIEETMCRSSRLQDQKYVHDALIMNSQLLDHY